MTTHPEPERDIDDYEAEFQKLDAKVAEQPQSGATPDKNLQEVRVQFRGATMGDMSVLELRLGDNVVCIEAKNLPFIASALPNLGTEGNTLVTWGYLPPEK